MTDLRGCSALIIDSSPTSRSVMATQLREFGMAQPAQCGRASEARKLLERHTYDVVLCEMDFQSVNVGDGSRAQSGPELLDELRRANLLPWSTVFIMVTGERTYAKVAEAAESALDSYLIKPFTAQALQDRVAQSRRRKLALEPIYAAVDKGDFEQAAKLCTVCFHARAPYWLYAARLGAELLLRLDMHAAARHLLDEVVKHQALPWARLGIARAQLGQQQVTPALRTLESLIAAEPTFADAYDVMGRTQMAMGQIDAAVATYQRAADLTPGAIRRQQKLGMLAFYNGDLETAAKSLDKAVVLGQDSKLFDLQVLVLLAVVRFRQRDAKGLSRCKTELQRVLDRVPGSPRLQRFRSVMEVLDLMLQRQVGQVIERLKRMSAEIHAPDFDIEAACNLLSLLSQLAEAELTLPDAELWVQRIARRFVGARGITELLVTVTQSHPPHAEVMRVEHQHIATLSEKAMMFSLSGAPERAVAAMLAHGRSTLNLKFLETAQGLLNNYADSLPDLPALQQELQAVRQQAGQRPSTAVPVGLDDDGAGRLRLRTKSPTHRRQVGRPPTAAPAAAA